MFSDLIDNLLEEKQSTLKELLVDRKITEAYMEDLETLCLVTDDGLELRFTCEETEFGFFTIGIQAEEN